jgi:rhodanese-related sulfurtransferase
MWYLINGKELDEYLDQGMELFLVDMRKPDAYHRGHIRGAVNIPAEELKQRVGELPVNCLIVLYCYHGPNSMRAARWLASLGYEAADVYGGIQAYRGKYLE